MYNFTKIEKKWQKFWEENKTFKAENGSPKKPYYILVEFPYPSGAGLHVGHIRSYTAQDVLARFKRMQGYNVLFPMGWDAFGAPAEQYAIKNHIHPREAVQKNIATFKSQMLSLGFSFDWDREFATTDPEYYKWTQWQFLQFYKHGMAYKAKSYVNWCPKCLSVLSNEDAAGGVCERCKTKVIQKEKEQWMLRMSDYAEDLLQGLDDTNFDKRVKLGQINWIGKSKGAEVDFKIAQTNDLLTVFTTRCDTLFGVTFMVLSPEHPLIDKLSKIIKNMAEVREYQTLAKSKSAFERTEINKDKTGIKLEGVTAINPVNQKVIPIFIADYVMMNYGTGAIMAVPAHDDRDYAFAKKFGLEIIPVIKGDITQKAFLEDGEVINSEFLNGCQDKKESIDKMLKYLQDKGLGREKVNYKLQDWVFSRQRFWGEPIPMVYCPKCGWQPIPTKELPLLLPDVTEYEATATGESPLAKIADWVNTRCPKCGGPAKRETDTMPNWAGSSWYFLRYMDPHNTHEFASMEAMKYWQKVSWYDGGMEHTARHLLYARFWIQFLYNIGLVPSKEMIWTRVSHGMVLGSDNQKMSKSKGNVINPDDLISDYGADVLRIYEMFMGDYEQDVPWSIESLRGCKRFIDRVYRLQDIVDSQIKGYTKSLETIQNKTIKGVTYDLERMNYNTFISKLMILTNSYEEAKKITKEDYHLLLILLNPVAPHLTEQLNEQMGYPLISSTQWPTYQEEKLQEEVKEIAVYVNGKVRGVVSINSKDDEQIVKEKALSIENVKKHLDGLTITKIIIIKNKIVSIVAK